MTVYAVGDIQGCYEPLLKGLEKIQFDPAADVLWCAGDLVNRGPASLAVLRYLKSLGDSCRCVLGNHDLHLLAAYYGQKELGKRDTASEVLTAPDCDELILWLRHQPLVQIDHDKKIIMTHAGVPHIWNVEQLSQYANDVETAVQSNKASRFFRHMYGNEPNKWREDLQGWDRLRTITNYLTRMRFVKSDATLEFSDKGSPASPPADHAPWFSFPNLLGDYQVVFGHWAALNGQTNNPKMIGLDTGCIWGGMLSFYSITDGKLAYAVNC